MTNQLYRGLACDRFVHRCSNCHPSRSSSTVAAILALDAAVEQCIYWQLFLEEHSVLSCMISVSTIIHGCPWCAICMSSSGTVTLQVSIILDVASQYRQNVAAGGSMHLLRRYTF